ncbi:MAG: DUF6553 family protein [Faecalibacterium sp.]
MEQQEKETLLQAYYDTEEIAQRKALLTEYIEAAPEDPLNPLREALFALRYQGREDADKFLWHYVNLAYVYKNAHSRFFKKSAQREFAESVQGLGFTLADAYEQAGEQALYREYRNASKRFLTVCAADKSYKRKMLGLASITDKQTQEKMAKDVWVLSSGLQQTFPEYSVMFTPFAQANVDAFADLYQDAAQLLTSIQ